MRRVSNPKNPWLRDEIEWDEFPFAKIEIYEEHAKSALTKNDSPDLPYDFGLNPYRGCLHACAYCYARRYHQYLGWGAGTDFDRKITVKINLHEVLERELRRKSWTRQPVSLSGITDCYQPIESQYKITRKCLEVLWRHRTPFGIITKSSLVERDIDILQEAQKDAGASVSVSIPFLDVKSARAIEPYAPSPKSRLETIRRLSDAGIPTGVSCAPTIPGLNDDALPEILKMASDAGARSAFITLVRLTKEVAEVFEERLIEAFPDRAERVLNAIKNMRGGKTATGEFGRRMVGEGPRWKAIQDLFELQCRRLGLNQERVFPEMPKKPGPQRESPSLFELDWS